MKCDYETKGSGTESTRRQGGRGSKVSELKDAIDGFNVSVTYC